MGKLYEVEVTFVGVVFAESEDEAQYFADDIVSGLSGCDYAEASECRGRYPSDYRADTLVYHNGSGDLSIAEAEKLEKEYRAKEDANKSQMDMFGTEDKT